MRRVLGLRNVAHADCCPVKTASTEASFPGGPLAEGFSTFLKTTPRHLP